MITGKLHSIAELEFSHDSARQKTSLSKRLTGGLCHLSKAFRSGNVLALQITNPTAGFFQGDQMQLSVTVRDYARVALTTPSATRFHTMTDGQAEVVQYFKLGRSAWLDYYPEITVPQHLASIKQQTIIHSEPDSEMFFTETIAPGRVFHGERYQFSQFKSSIEIFQASDIIAKEQWKLNPHDGKLPISLPPWESCYFTTIWILSPRSELILKLIKNFHHAHSDYCASHSLLTPHLIAVKLITPSTILLKKYMNTLRGELQTYFPDLSNHFRKS